MRVCHTDMPRHAMGKLIYNVNTSTEIDDRALAHLQIVIIGKLRRQESFAFSWKTPQARATDAAPSGSPRSSPSTSSTPVADRRPSTGCGSRL
jgi:hypothetical protein